MQVTAYPNIITVVKTIYLGLNRVYGTCWQTVKPSENEEPNGDCPPGDYVFDHFYSGCANYVEAHTEQHGPEFGLDDLQLLSDIGAVILVGPLELQAP